MPRAASAATLAACALALSLAGCGGETRSSTGTAQSSDTSSAYEGGYDADDAAQSTPDSDPYAAQEDSAVPADESYESTEPTTADVPAEEEPAEAGPRPEDVAQWKPEHYKSAKLENDPKLADAVRHLDDPQWRTSENVAKDLAGLLTLEEKPRAAQPAPTTDGYGGYGGSGGGASSSSNGYGGGYGGSGYGGSGNGTAAPEMAQISPELAREVVAALGRNSSAWSGEALKTLLVGELDTPLDKQSMFSEALHAMANNMRPQYEDIILQLATAPEKLIKAPENNAQGAGASASGYGGGYGGGYGSPGSGPLTVEWVRPEMLRELEQWASSGLRLKLARFLDNPQVHQETADEFERLLVTEDPRNLPAQIVLFQNPKTTEGTRQQIEQRLAQGGRNALAHMMGVEADSLGMGGYGSGYGSGYGGAGYGGSGSGASSYDGGYGRGGGVNPPRSIRPIETQANVHGFYLQEGRPSREEGRPSRDGGSGYGGYGGGYGGSSGVAAPPEQDPTETYSQLAALLWTDDNADKLGSILLDLERLDTRADLVRILASMPTTGARRNLQKLFEKFERDGPAGFTTAGLLGQNLTDPAFLLVAKKAYHGKETQRPARGRGAGGADAYGGYGAAGGAGGAAGIDPWEQEVEAYVRFLSEALAQGESPWQAEEGSEVETPAADSTPQEDTGPRSAMPVRLHRGAEVVDEYHARWPADVAGKLPGANIGPLEIHYVRIEEENRPAQLATSYRRQAGRKPIERTSDGGGWIDGLVENGQTGDRHSIDIRIYNDPDTSGVNAQLRPNDARPIVMEILTVTIPGADAAAQVSDAGAADEELPF